jgi:hypothetical protein
MPITLAEVNEVAARYNLPSDIHLEAVAPGTSTARDLKVGQIPASISKSEPVRGKPVAYLVGEPGTGKTLFIVANELVHRLDTDTGGLKLVRPRAVVSAASALTQT